MQLETTHAYLHVFITMILARGPQTTIEPSEPQRAILETNLVAAGLSKSRQVNASEPIRAILEFSLLGAWLDKSRQV